MLFYTTNIDKAYSLLNAYQSSDNIYRTYYSYKQWLEYIKNYGFDFSKEETVNNNYIFNIIKAYNNISNKYKEYGYEYWRKDIKKFGFYFEDVEPEYQYEPDFDNNNSVTTWYNLIGVIVEELPIENIQSGLVYLLKLGESEDTCVYGQYMYLDDRWCSFGSTSGGITVDLSNYYTKSQIDTLLESGSSGSSSLTQDLICNVAIGNVTANKKYTTGTDLEVIIRDMLTQYIKPAVDLLLNPSTTLYDKVESSVASITLNATITKKTSSISKIEFYVNNTVVNTVTTNVSNGGSFPYIYRPTTPINNDTTFKIVATDTQGGQGSTSKTIKFVGKSYYGIIDATIGEPTEAVIKTLNTTLKDTRKYVYSGITTNWGKICYAYPSSLGYLSSIKDMVNNLNYTTSFSKVTVTVDGIEYYVYTQIDPSAATDVEITFD